MKRPIIIVSVVVVFVLLGASMLSFFSLSAQRSVAFEPGYGGGAAPEVGFAPAEPAFLDASAPLPASEEVKNSFVQGQERLVIENADLAIVVKDPKARMNRINDLTKELGGFVVSSNLYQSFTSAGVEVPEASMVIRVPSEKLDEALDEIKRGVVDVQYENRSGLDVTSQYVDLQSQLSAKQAAEKKLLEILDKAEKAEDVLAIYLQVQSVQTEIEVLKGQIKYYEESAALSAISVRIIAEEGTQPIEIGPWKPEGAAKDAVQDLIFFFQNFVDFLIRFGLFILPSLILIAIPLYAFFVGGRALIRRFGKTRAKVEEKEEAKK